MTNQIGFAVLLLAAACGSTASTSQKKQQGETCRLSAECDAQLQCNHVDPSTEKGKCDPTCVDNADCVTGTTWNESQCKCVAPAGAVGDPCGGNIANPPPACQSGLVCQNTSGLPAGDVGGKCVAADSCQANGAACTVASDCCSGNCITRTSPGYCCEPGGCP